MVDQQWKLYLVPFHFGLIPLYHVVVANWIWLLATSDRGFPSPSVWAWQTEAGVVAAHLHLHSVCWLFVCLHVAHAVDTQNLNDGLTPLLTLHPFFYMVIVGVSSLSLCLGSAL